MSIVQWNPWREFDDLFTRAAGHPGESLAGADWLPAADIIETEQGYRIEMEIPAVAADDVDVAVKDGVLTVSGERRSETDSETGSEGGKRHHVERRWGRFSRSFRLPENVDWGSIDARARDGVLYLNLAKKENARPRRIEVQAA
ncbi:MAG: Hsp20/alpha crystallin family protein [Gammaproteobacteria bacterium]|nr:Hsp20/alpha crystallin family protein [Gammaproteobacteria bacterium]